MGPAQGHHEFIADPASESPRLHKSQMVGVRGPARAHETRLRRHELEMLAVAVAPRFAQSECAFVDVPGNGIIHPLVSACSWRTGLNLSHNRYRHSRGHVPARPPSAGTSSTAAKVSLGPAASFVVKFNAGAECSQQRDTARRVLSFRKFLRELALWRRGCQ